MEGRGGKENSPVRPPCGATACAGAARTSQVATAPALCRGLFRLQHFEPTAMKNLPWLPLRRNDGPAVNGSEALECGSLLPLSAPRACSRGSHLPRFSALYALLSGTEFPASELAGRESGSKLPHSKASRRLRGRKRYPAASKAQSYSDAYTAALKARPSAPRPPSHPAPAGPWLRRDKRRWVRGPRPGLCRRWRARAAGTCQVEG